jgi:hypothetical protein
VLKEVAEKTGVDFKTIRGDINQGTHELKRMRTGMYQRYWGGNMDEGWTRLMFEKFSFPYKSLMDAEITKGELNKNYDAIIFPDDSPGMITGDRVRFYGGRAPAYPPEYRSGIHKEGIEALKTFVENGGTMITLSRACEFAIEVFGLSIRDVVADVDSKDFFCPGSTVKARFDNTHPLAYGMPAEGLVLYWSSPVFSILPNQENEKYETIVRYQERDLLQSGWLIGEEYLAKQGAMIKVDYGKGEIILIGFPAQHRCQTHGTFKLLFNALIR